MFEVFFRNPIYGRNQLQGPVEFFLNLWPKFGKEVKIERFVVEYVPYEIASHESKLPNQATFCKLWKGENRGIGSCIALRVLRALQQLSDIPRERMAYAIFIPASSILCFSSAIVPLYSQYMIRS